MISVGQWLWPPRCLAAPETVVSGDEELSAGELIEKPQALDESARIGPRGVADKGKRVAAGGANPACKKPYRLPGTRNVMVQIGGYEYSHGRRRL